MIHFSFNDLINHAAVNVHEHDPCCSIVDDVRSRVLAGVNSGRFLGWICVAHLKTEYQQM